MILKPGIDWGMDRGNAGAALPLMRYAPLETRRWPDPAQKETATLILTRRVGETLYVGDDVTVIVLGVQGQQVRIGIEAPKDVCAGASGGNLSADSVSAVRNLIYVGGPTCAARRAGRTKRI